MNYHKSPYGSMDVLNQGQQAGTKNTDIAYYDLICSIDQYIAIDNRQNDIKMHW